MIISKPLRSEKKGHKKCKKLSYLPIAIKVSHDSISDTISLLFSPYKLFLLY